MTTSEALLPSSEQLTDDFARAYSAAVRTDAPMRPFTHVVESLRDATRRATSAFRLSDVYDSALLEVVGEATEPVLAALRRDFRTRMLRRAEEFVAEASDRWFDVFGAALGEYDLPLCTALIPLGRTVGVDPARLDALDAAVSAARDDWWVDLVEPVGWLLDVGPLSTPVRARLMALASLVQLRSLENQAAAFLLAEEAHRLDAQSVQTVTALAMAHLGRGERTEAEALLSAYLEAHPDEASAHAAFSDCAVADDPATAEVRALDSLDRLPYRSALVYKVFELSCTDRKSVV